ncbi:helix-turn-helix transcriptional regulator [Streptacidiphilus sp. P02-A3a]|uniref:helix-turn-helix domain-containing protein n=1 Tax=Streptacidiphilus sp. P02-A3a TaxID=2704468 RepID=UPI0015FDBFCE|nr:helix-turn-helix transcriptional regulator [Streptacidiphilus sp. P02-A3a]QMU69347.1 helix-turn-helix domain-containing protein [Streptacidiphilus sp. P02-A3a]
MNAPACCLYCGRELPQRPSAIGRPLAYCNARCRQAAYRGRRSDNATAVPDPPQSDGPAAEFADDLLQEARHLIRLLTVRNASAIEPVEQAAQLARTLDKLTVALVHRARAGHVSWQRLATALDMRPETARKAFRSAPPPANRSVAPRPAEPDQPDRPEVTGWTSTPTHPHSWLAPVLSRLHRASGLTQRDLADRVGVSPSLLSRVLTGERFPNWPLTERLSRACGADPVVLQKVWQDEWRRQEQSPPAVMGATGGLLAAPLGEPLGPGEIAAALPGNHLPHWPVLSVLGGGPFAASVRSPGWTAARSSGPRSPER